MKKFLVTGCRSGLGKFLFESLGDVEGLDRNNYHEISKKKYDTIVHCAFNKEVDIKNYKKYIDDNIFLTQRLKKIEHKKFIYISSIDVYSENLNVYSIFKKISESLLDTDDLILRCSMIVGKTMGNNHLKKISSLESRISLSENSIFDYILMDDIKFFLENFDYKNLKGTFDFVSNNPIYLRDVKKFFKSNTQTGDYVYNSNNEKFTNPIYKIVEKLNKSSIKNLQIFYE